MRAEELLRKLTQTGPIKHAYCLIPDPENPGYYFDVHLIDVYAEKSEFLERDARSSKPVFGLERIYAAASERHRRKEWDK